MNSPDNYNFLVESGLLKIDIDSMIGDAMITITKDLPESGLSAIDVDDLTGDRIITRFPLMRLPTEIRLHIFSFLLPDLKTIYPPFKGGCYSYPGSYENDYGKAYYRHDFTPGDMAIMRSNRQIYDETSNYLYNRSTIMVSVGDDGVNFLSTHRGCGEMSRNSLIEIPFHKFKLVWLQVEAAFDQRKHLVHVRRNLLDFCTALCQTDPPKCLRVDLFDARHWDAGTTLHFHETASIQGRVRVVTEDVENSMRRPDAFCTEEIAEKQIWRAANSTGTSLAATDIEVILQPLKLLRGVKRCQISLNPHLQSNDLLRELAARHEEIVQSKRDLVLADLKSVHDMSEELSRLAVFIHNEGIIDIHHIVQKRMKHLW